MIAARSSRTSAPYRSFVCEQLSWLTFQRVAHQCVCAIPSVQESGPAVIYQRLPSVSHCLALNCTAILERRGRQTSLFTVSADRLPSLPRRDDVLMSRDTFLECLLASLYSAVTCIPSMSYLSLTSHIPCLSHCLCPRRCDGGREPVQCIFVFSVPSHMSRGCRVVADVERARHFAPSSRAIAKRRTVKEPQCKM